jgi:hypothetical protein
MASVAHTTGTAQQRETMIVISHPRGLDRKLRSELIGFSRCFIQSNAYRRRRSQGRQGMRHLAAKGAAGERIPNGLHLLSPLG